MVFSNRLRSLSQLALLGKYDALVWCRGSILGLEPRDRWFDPSRPDQKLSKNIIEQQGEEPQLLPLGFSHSGQRCSCGDGVISHKRDQIGGVLIITSSTQNTTVQQRVTCGTLLMQLQRLKWYCCLQLQTNNEGQECSDPWAAHLGNLDRQELSISSICSSLSRNN